MNHRLTVTAAVAAVATSIALYPLISGTGWFWAGAGAAVVAAAVGTVTRLRVLPAIACFIAALAGLFLYLNILFAGPESLLRVVPTGASVHHLMWLAGQASGETAKYAPPVPASHGITLLATAGIGLVAAITDLIGVRLRRPAITGLPLLVLFCVPLTTDARPSGFGAAVVFCLGIAGYLALLSAEGRERVRLWGRLVRTWQGGTESRGPDTRQLAAAGRRIGFAAVVLALCLPLLVPGLRHHRLFPGTGTGPGNGYSGSISLPDPLVQMNQQLRTPHPETVLTYRTADSTTPPYLQVYVLGRLGPNEWSLAPPPVTIPLTSGPLPAVPGASAAVPAVTVHETISLGPALRSGSHLESYLPLPYAPRSVTVHGDWRVDGNSLTILTADTQLAGLRYTVTSKDIAPSPQQLRQAGAPPAAEEGYLSVPSQFQPLMRLARHVTAGRTSAYAKAVALQQWFTEPGNFTYSLSATEPRDASALITFLTRTKRGYCQQFAFAMAVMARLLGIPSRVVVGYTQGSYRGNDTWAVRTSDAHAWPELYFTGAGWLRFEPTPSDASGQAGQATASAPAYSYPPLVGGVPTPQPTSRAHQHAGLRPSATPRGGVVGPKLRGITGRGGASAGRRAATPLSAALLFIAVLAVAAVGPRTARSLTRRRRWLRAADDAERAHAAWGELRDDLTDHRIGCRASESPRALARRLTGILDLGADERAALERIALAEERARYSPSPVTSGRPRADVATVRRAVAKSCDPGARWRARVLPASSLRPAWAALQNALDVFSWMDMITTGLRRQASGRRSQTTFSWRS
jgi:transglutaminase-like putative cysteine protease